MANGGRNKPKGGGETQQPLIASERIEEPATATFELTLDDILEKPLPSNLPPEMFTGPGLLALADLVPVDDRLYRPRRQSSASSTSRSPNGSASPRER